MTTSAPSAPPADLLLPRFEAFIEALCRCVAAEGPKRRIAGPLVTLIWIRLRRLAERFARLATQPPSHRPHHRSGKSGARKNLPRGFAWLLRLMPATAAIADRQFRHHLEDPEMAEFIAAPLIRPHPPPALHTIGIRVPAPLRLPPRTRKRCHPPKVAPGTVDPAGSTSDKPLSPVAPQPDIPGRPRAPGATRFFPRRKLRA